MLSLLTSCSKETELEPEIYTDKTEDPNIKIPVLNLSVSKSGNNRTVTITGKFRYLYFDQDYHKADGSLPGDKLGIRTAYTLHYDKLRIYSKGSQPFAFERTAPYTYSLKYTMSPKDYERNRITLVEGGKMLYEFEF